MELRSEACTGSFLDLFLCINSLSLTVIFAFDYFFRNIVRIQS